MQFYLPCSQELQKETDYHLKTCLLYTSEIISIGGSFSYYDELLMPKLTTKLQEKHMTFNEENLPEIVTAELQNDAGILGAIL